MQPERFEHTKDEDCTVGEDNFCVICKVDHSGECPECEGHGFHKDGCTLSDAFEG